jgi:hypothetical protein
MTEDNARETYNAILVKGTDLGLHETVLVEPVFRSDTDTHDIEGTETCMQLTKHSVDPKCIPKPFIPDTPCDRGVHFTDFSTTSRLHLQRSDY